MNATLSRPGAPAQLMPAACKLAGFRRELYQCLTSRRDGLFGLADAVLCHGGRVTDLARLSLVPEAGRGHGGVYDAVSADRVDAGRLRRALAGLPLPAWPDGRIRLAAARPAPGQRRLEPMWIWASDPRAGSDEAATATLWQSYLRRFDLEHAFCFLKVQLGWDKPALRDPATADRWTWLLIACHAQLHLARPLTADTRLPWQRPQGPGQPEALTPGRVRAGFRGARHAVGTPASAAKTTRPGPGRPKGSKNKHKAPRHPVRKRPAKTRKPADKPPKVIKQTG